MARPPKKKVSGAHVSLSLSRPSDLLQKLEWEAEAMSRYWETDLVGPSYCLINGAITAWQLGDWVAGVLEDVGKWDLATKHFKTPIGSLFDLQREMRRCSALVACQQIAAAAKHMKINDDGTFRHGFQAYEHFDIRWSDDPSDSATVQPSVFRVLEISFPVEEVDGRATRRTHGAKLVLQDAIEWWHGALEGLSMGIGASVTWLR